MHDKGRTTHASRARKGDHERRKERKRNMEARKGEEREREIIGEMKMKRHAKE